LRTRHLNAQARLDRLRDRLLTLPSRRLALSAERLRLLSPLASLDRGWALVRREDGSLVRSVAEVAAGTPIEITLRDGTLHATVAPRKDEDPP
ncbi:MAG TPA: exodeoxyribonuclease VII large subunit, partial [Myxococcota bacterium]|nr:exodeoxyribonuclease VII large subunit [Myxococcota bacterium]